MSIPAAYGGPSAECVVGHTVFIYDRGGTTRFGTLMSPTYVEWNRVRDALSTATVRIEGDACSAQADLLNAIRSHRHEMVIYRGSDRVWEGPIHKVAWHRDYVEITANDVIDYLLHCPLTQTWSNANPNVGVVSTRIGNIIEYEMTHSRVQVANGVNVTVPAWESLTPPANVVPYVVVHNFVNEAKTAAVTYPYQMTVGEHLESLARYSGIDYTAIGRAIHIWDTSRALGRTQQMTEANFLDEIVVTEYGAEHAQSAYVLGQPPEGQDAPLVGQALRTDNLDYYGPWTEVYTPYTESGTNQPTQGELNSQALRNLAGRSPAPVEVRIPDNSGVILGDAISMRELVPGVQIPLRATLSARKYYQMQKIDSIRVTESAQEGERIALTLIPTSRPDADDELQDGERRVTAPFSGDGNYQLVAIASKSGTSYSVRARVEQTGGANVSGTGQPWTIVLEKTTGVTETTNGTWDFNFQYYNTKTAGTAQTDNAAPGLRNFSASVTIGGSVGSATVSGTITI